MEINHEISKVMIFNNARSIDFEPEMNLDGVEMQVVDELRMLGLVVTSHLKWKQKTESICKRAYSHYSRMWMLRRLKILGADNDDLKEVFEKQIRRIVKFGTPKSQRRLDS